MNGSEKREILIVGAGVIGLAIARELHRRGFRAITILERGQVGSEASFAAAGMLAPNAETNRIDGFFHLCDASNKLYPKFAAELFDETGVDIELERSGTLYAAFDDADLNEIRQRFDWQKQSGLAVEHLNAENIRKLEPFISPNVREALFFPNDWQVENRQLLAALCKYAALNEIEIVENAEVKNLISENGKIVGAETTERKFHTEIVILASGAWTSFIQANNFVLPRVKPIRGQMISFRTAKRLFERVIYSPRGYLVPRLDGRILVGATVEDVGFEKSITTAGTEFLRENALEIAPNLVNLEISESWAGLRPFAADGLPILGAIPEMQNLFIATAHYRNGILLAPKTAEILANLIVGDESKSLQTFSPRRFFTAKG